MILATFIARLRNLSGDAHNRVSMKSTSLLTAATLLVALCGCDTKLRLTPTTGELFVAERPAHGALVIFHPLEDANGAKWVGGFPRATVEADGKFTLSSLATGDGAPSGKYAVLVTWPVGEPAAEGDPEGKTPPDRLQGRYASPELSTLRAEVGTQPTTIPRINLQGISP